AISRQWQRQDWPRNKIARRIGPIAARSAIRPPIPSQQPEAALHQAAQRVYVATASAPTTLSHRAYQPAEYFDGQSRRQSAVGNEGARSHARTPNCRLRQRVPATGLVRRLVTEALWRAGSAAYELRLAQTPGFATGDVARLDLLWLPAAVALFREFQSHASQEGCTNPSRRAGHRVARAGSRKVQFLKRRQ